jgi:hypothetical protein
MLLGTSFRNHATRYARLPDPRHIVVLTILSRCLLPAVFLLIGAFISELFFSESPRRPRRYLLPKSFVHWITNALPKVHPLYWFLVT